MTWFAFAGLNGGKAINLAGLQEKEASGEGFHGYGTEQEAESHPNSVNFVTRPLADTWIADYNAAVHEGAQPGGPNDITTPGGAAAAVAQGTTGISFSSIQNALSAFYAKVTDGKMWRSLGWLLLGIALMLAGIAMWIGPSAGRRSPIGMAREALG